MGSAAAIPDDALKLGLNEDEYRRIESALGRSPTETELHIFSAMYSEHCCYKSSAVWLKKLPTEGPQVVCGPGENAGVVALEEGDDGLACVFKMESHNHPSFIEPFQGAATGVGGILRDIFTMGARPVAILNSLRFGGTADKKTPFYLKRVVAGIGHYGNCIGVPTVGGECGFSPSYDGNILVNVMAVGLVRKDRIFYSKLDNFDDSARLVYVGAKTGRDGIAGAIMASASFGEGNDSQRSTVQVGDPFAGKLLLEACLELMHGGGGTVGGGVLAVQDMGAAGLTSSCFEMAAKSKCGVELDLDAVPLREQDMTAAEIMLSESQERMLFILNPEGQKRAAAVFKKWGLNQAVVGRLVKRPVVSISKDKKSVAELPITIVVDDAPRYNRPFTPPQSPPPAADLPPPKHWLKLVGEMLGGSELCSRRWIWRQYDYMVRTNTLVGPGGDAALIRLPPKRDGTARALAITADCTPRYVARAPKQGAAQAVAEAFRNLCAVGAKPLAVTDCLNFGNPEDAAIMGQFAAAVEGIAAACVELGMPVVSGNVSLYNQTDHRAVEPSPTIGAVGLMADTSKLPRFKVDDGDSGAAMVLVGNGKGHLGGSLYEESFFAVRTAPPPLDLKEEKRNGEFIVKSIADGLIAAAHDLSDGGLLAAAAEMCGTVGMTLTPPSAMPAHRWLLGEDQGRYLLAVRDYDGLAAAAVEFGVKLGRVGVVGGGNLTFDGVFSISLTELASLREGWFENFVK